MFSSVSFLLILFRSFSLLCKNNENFAWFWINFENSCENLCSDQDLTPVSQFSLCIVFTSTTRRFWFFFIWFGEWIIYYYKLSVFTNFYVLWICYVITGLIRLIKRPTGFFFLSIFLPRKMMLCSVLALLPFPKIIRFSILTHKNSLNYELSLFYKGCLRPEMQALVVVNRHDKTSPKPLFLATWGWLSSINYKQHL